MTWTRGESPRRGVRWGGCNVGFDHSAIGKEHPGKVVSQSGERRVCREVLSER